MTEKVNILLVDDKKENLFTLETLLEELNVIIFQTTSGLEALKIALNNEIGTILLDVQMPEIDGYEVAKLLKENPKTRHIPVIFVTAINQEPEHVLQGYKTGAVDYLFKPLNPSITIAKVQSFIRLYQQQKELEKKNAELENLNMLIQNAVDLMVIFEDKSLLIRNLNPSWEKTLKLQIDDVLHKDFSSFISVNRETLLSLLSNAKESEGKVLNYEQKMFSKHGKTFWFSWCFVFRNEKWYGNGRNITDKKLADVALKKAYDQLEEKVKIRTKELEEANAMLKRSNADLDSFVYTASHDLKLPIANLEGLHLTLQEELKNKGEEVEGITDMVGHCIIQLKDTIHDLINIVQKPKEEKLEEVIKGDDCDFILEEIKISIQDLISSHCARILSNFNGCRINFPKATFKSIIYNLLTNAIKYKSPARDPLVEISLIDKGKYNVLTVADNGLGISKEGLDKMFEKFERINPDQHIEGTGIGLFIVKNSVEKFGGKIEVESEEGIGSKFKVFFKKA